MQKLKALRVVQQMIAVQERLLQQQAAFDSSSQGRPVDTTLTERLLQQQAAFDSSGQGRPVDTTLTERLLQQQAAFDSSSQGRPVDTILTERLLQQQAAFDSSQGRPVDTTLTERLLQQQAAFDSSGQGRPVDTTLTDQPIVTHGMFVQQTHTWTDAPQTISESQVDMDPTLPSEVSSQCSSLNILPLLPLSASDAVGGTAETTPTGYSHWGQDLSATVEGRMEGSSLEDERRNQLQLLNRKIARGRLQGPPEEDVSLDHLRKKKGEWTLDSRPSLTVSHPRTSIAAIFPAERGITHTSARIQPETTDVSKKVSPLDYRLPGVPSYVQPPVPTTTCTSQRMPGQMSSTAVPSTTSISVTSSMHAPSILSASSFSQYGHLETLTHTSTLDDVSGNTHCRSTYSTPPGL